MLPSPQTPLPSGGTMFLPPQPQAAACTSICCTCGVSMPPNAANTCARCLRSHVDITEGAPRHAAVVYCPLCSSYLQPPRSWLRAAPESPELMQILLRRVHRPLARLGVTLSAAEFVFTEPHSKRLKLRLRLRREVLHGVTMEQAHVVEFTVHDRLCDGCGRAQADPDQWAAVVQVRQRASHRRTLLHLEQQLVRHAAAAAALRVDAASGGLDFFFASRSHAARLVEFVSSVAPARVGTVAKQLVSHDTKSNTYNFRHTFAVELSPICRDDLVFLPREASRDLGGLGPLVLCVNVTNALALLDTSNARVVVLGIKEYDRYKFEPLLISRRLIEYVVLDIELDRSRDVTMTGSRYMMAWAQVARASDLGKNNTIFTVKTHLGHRLNPGDHAFGYDLYGVNANNQDLEQYGQSHQLPDAVLVKKSYKKEDGKLQDGRNRESAEIEEIAMGLGCIDLNSSDEKELDELLEDLTL
ncbi:hypothetical protein EJB05_52649, partial [Eragrostis curvula]